MERDPSILSTPTDLTSTDYRVLVIVGHLSLPLSLLLSSTLTVVNAGQYLAAKGGGVLVIWEHEMFG